MPGLKHITQLPAAEPLDGSEFVVVSQKDPAITITAVTIAALAVDNSFNDVGAGFVTAGFTVGDIVQVEGFTAPADNLIGAVVTAVTTTKLTIGGTDGDVIVDELAGNSVTISKIVDRRTTLDDIATLFGL